jgi:hypothetical protein
LLTIFATQENTGGKSRYAYIKTDGSQLPQLCLLNCIEY